MMEKPEHEVTHVTDKWPSNLQTTEAIAEKLGMEPYRVRDLALSGYMPHYRIDGGAPLYVLCVSTENNKNN